MTPKLTDGSRLRRAMDAALRAAGEDLTWDESDRLALNRAGHAADRAEQLRVQYDDELNGEARATNLTKLSAEIRALDRLVIEVTRRIDADLRRLGQTVNVRKQRAANYRWSRQRAINAGDDD